MSKKALSIIGLIGITVLAAIQYVFLENVPESVSTFSFLCITNLLGLVILGAIKFGKLRSLKKSTLKKGALFAAELTAMNFFMLLGSRGTDPVVTSSILSMYFIFITPLLLLMKKKVNFLSGIATVIAIIALLLMFGADTDALFSSVNVIYLMITNVFFAGYVVSISVLGGDEDPIQLTLTQMIFGTALSFVGWGVESLLGKGTMALPTDMRFWVCVIFIGVFIRAVYGVVQMAAQKHVSALTASLIFASEIVITLVLNPLMCAVFKTEYTPATIFQVIGCVFFVISTLLVDETIMGKFGFSGMELPDVTDKNGKVIHRVSVSKKMIVTTLTCTMLTLILSTLVCLISIHLIRVTAVENSTSLGENASTVSATALTDELEDKMLQTVEDKATLAEAKLDKYASAVKYAASYASSLYSNPNSFPDKEVQRPDAENAGKWAMQRAIATESISYASLQHESQLIGNMVDVFEPIAKNNENISAIYMGTENGLMVSYDTHSDNAASDGELYYEFREADWYTSSKTAIGVSFSDTYQDSFGQGLTITCYSPFFDANGKFMGCVAIDILMNDLNRAMVEDGIIDPSIATLINNEGEIIASADLDPVSEDTFSIFDEKVNSPLSEVGKDILKRKEGITSTGEGMEANYIAYSTIESTDWTLCILTPVKSVIGPAEEIRDSINESTQSVVASVVKGILIVVQSCLTLSALILLGVTFLVGRFSKKISNPLRKLEEDVQVISQGNFQQHTDVDTDDEIGSLAKSFNFMTDSIQKYMVDLKEVTAQEERIASELSVATRIQASMLPSTFPDRDEFNIYATMTPAKEVGGDFYDFFMVDDRHLAIVMADVSGKGVPAALFMVIGKTLIKDHTHPDSDLGEVFTRVNNLLCESNSEDLFITAFEGVLDLVTGEFNFVNAGHEIPFICRKGGVFEPKKLKAGFVLAGVEDMEYQAGSMVLEPGDKVFQYTDGVPEATDADNELFGMERLEASLKRVSASTTVEILNAVKSDVDAFVGEAPQFDDLTMLCLEYKKRMEA